MIVDTGPLVAVIDKSDQWHMKTVEALKSVKLPMVTCEAVLTETWFLLRGHPMGWQSVSRWIGDGVLAVVSPFEEKAEQSKTLKMMRQYQDLPMSFADACLVAMVEQGIGHRVFTLDHHFGIYRQSGRRKVPILHPE